VRWPLTAAFVVPAHGMRVSTLLCGLMIVAGASHAEPMTKVFINGQATPVYFNDGDSFRPFAGPYKGSQSRLAGYNTLESFGSVHSWGDWTETEMWVLAKAATHVARHGVWNCETDGKKDGYGRMLLQCKDLAKTLIGLGLAQVMSVDDKPGDSELIAAQREAVAARRGMWAHGVPDYVLSSLHSTAEGGGKDGKTYNRMISSWDGHSEKWYHEDVYAECQKVCRELTDIDDAAWPAVLAALKANPKSADVLKGMDDTAIRRHVRDAMNFGGATSLPSAQRGAIDEVLNPLKATTATHKSKDSCQIYVDFQRRFGGDRAVCLR
jgi:endonuclease YncB( thermonuclease family)